MARLSDPTTNEVHEWERVLRLRLKPSVRGQRIDDRFESLKEVVIGEIEDRILDLETRVQQDVTDKAEGLAQLDNGLLDYLKQSRDATSGFFTKYEKEIKEMLRGLPSVTSA